MRHFVRVVCAVVAFALIGYGILQPVDQDERWILALWVAAPLLLIAARLSLPQQPRGISRSVQNLSLVIALGFSLLALELLRQQFVRADQIYNRIYVDEQTGQSTSNVRQVIEAERVQRGKMIDRNGVVLVDTRMMQNGLA